MKFIPSRLGVSIVMREILVVRSAMDLMRCLPVVHMNFLGYDEQSHRRGPDSDFAHWTLKGIDQAIKRIYDAGGRSMCRDYDLWIYSDHGQLKTEPYERVNGESVSKAVSRIFNRTMDRANLPRSGIQFQRSKMLKVKRHRPETQPPEQPPIVTALGPLGGVYLENVVPSAVREQMARDLVKEAGIPMVFCGNGPESVAVWTANGKYILPNLQTGIAPQHQIHRPGHGAQVYAF